jgi:hypothetical protein
MLEVSLALLLGRRSLRRPRRYPLGVKAGRSPDVGVQSPATNYLFAMDVHSPVSAQGADAEAPL